jgi:hypothetical protein
MKVGDVVVEIKTGQQVTIINRIAEHYIVRKPDGSVISLFAGEFEEPHGKATN